MAVNSCQLDSVLDPWTHKHVRTPVGVMFVTVSTRPRKKSTHPAAPVMTAAVKKKAGIKTKLPPKSTTKDQTIRKLQACIVSLENPDEESFSKDPLVCIDQAPITCEILTLSSS